VLGCGVCKFLPRLLRRLQIGALTMNASDFAITKTAKFGLVKETERISNYTSTQLDTLAEIVAWCLPSVHN
jgi:hypothetical protein